MKHQNSVYIDWGSITHKSCLLLYDIQRIIAFAVQQTKISYATFKQKYIFLYILPIAFHWFFLGTISPQRIFHICKLES